VVEGNVIYTDQLQPVALTRSLQRVCHLQAILQKVEGHPLQDGIVGKGVEFFGPPHSGPEGESLAMQFYGAAV